MKITSLDIKGFGKFNQLKIIPGLGFNMVYETNESGKSTLQALILAMFYGQKGGRMARDGSLPPLKHYKPWNAEQYAGVLEYVLENGASYRIGRNFEKGTVNVYDGVANNITSKFSQEKDVGPKFAEEHMGLDEVTFQRSAFIRQMQCAIDDGGRKNLVEKLSNLNTTGSEELSLTRAVNGLESALLERVGTGRSTTRPLDKVNIRLSELEQKKQTLLDLNERYLDTALSLHEKKSLLKELTLSLESKRLQKDAQYIAKLKALEKELDNLLHENADLDLELIACMAALMEQKNYEDITESTVSKAVMLLHDEEQIQEAIELEELRLKDLQDRREDLNHSLDPEDLFQQKTQAVEKGLKNYSDSKNQARTKSVHASIGKNIPMKPSWTRTIVISLGFLALVLLFSFINNLSPALLIMGIIAAALSGVIFFLSNQKELYLKSQTHSDANVLNTVLSNAGFADMVGYIQYREGQLKVRGHIEHSTQQILESQKSLALLHSKSDTNSAQWVTILKLSVENYESIDKTTAVNLLKQGVENLKTTKEHQKALLAKKTGIKGKCEIVLREAGSLMGKALLTAEDFKKALPNFGETKEIKGSVPVAYFKEPSAWFQESQLDEELAMVESRINEVKLEIATLKTRLEQAPSEGELTSVMEEIALVQENKEKLEMVGSSLTLSSQILNEVALKLQRDYIPALNEEMSCMMDRLTSGRYKKLRTNDDLQLNLEVPETDEIIPASRLSGGTIDQVYFCMRLAAVRLLEKGRELLPLFLDEPFSQYDESRVQSGFELLRDMSEERQIFFFTCREREFEQAKSIFGENMNRINL